MLVDKLQHLVADEWIVSNMFVNAFSVAAKLATLELEFFGHLVDAHHQTHCPIDTL